MNLSLSDALNYLSLIPGLLPLVQSAIKTVEAPGNGAAKTEAVIGIVRTTIDKLFPGSHTADQIEMILDCVRAVIPIFVTLFNTIGVFSKSTPALPGVPVIPALPPAPVPLPIPDPVAGEIAKLQAEIIDLENKIVEATAKKDRKNPNRLKNLEGKLKAARENLEKLQTKK